ncbi:NADP-dependent isocitrate dehydrogenase [Flavilitoribacter nigricans]|uniref:Isocitrate dehydrogenase [NADP] n=1 Tax=Flavilitoribacter nigricans (strain ATCC 23147 / DSM 23189 / NBRC 102662 / NCIMB 1420 / SS-2) TaxID=1122177 RepID=A0A2D0NFR3_FLAN2|nr:NADP-dependent isocitrate dehydrogenase [Flavilitoribacter nigricans]PHN07009.1 isocitrate dehydrogenase [Flavilitoribacter nigricans DSM 23189 = NBRC 102662]
MHRITIAKGDGIGPEIMDATLRILQAAGAPLEFDEVEIGEKVYRAGNTSGISSQAWQIIRQNRIFLKAPITTPQGGGYKSLNVTLRKTLNLFANVRPCRSYHPCIQTRHPELDVVVIRENEEDLYAGIEHQQTPEVVQCLKLISRPGCEKIIRYAFEYARQHGRKKVTCFTKDNIMKQTDGLFHRVFQEIAAEYPEFQSEHLIIDIGTARLADTPERFDVIVVPNLYGDIISDVVAQITGSVGLAGSANIGTSFAMFEAIHGSAPDIAGEDKANPSGLLQAALMMLDHLGETEVAARIKNAWLKTLEEGLHTADIFRKGYSRQLLGTTAFADAVIARLGSRPEVLPAASPASPELIQLPEYQRKSQPRKELMGVDIFVDWPGKKSDELAEMLKNIEVDGVQLSMITNRGIKVWPNGFEETFCTDHWRCRFETIAGNGISKQHIIQLLKNAEDRAIDAIKTENLYAFDGTPAFSMGQGQ